MIYRVKDIEAVFSKEVRRYPVPIQFGVYLIAFKKGDKFTNFVIPKILGIDLPNMDNWFSGWIVAFPGLRVFSDESKGEEFGLQLQASVQFNIDLKSSTTRFLWIPQKRIILPEKRQLVDYFYDDMLGKQFLDHEITDNDMWEKVVTTPKEKAFRRVQYWKPDQKIAAIKFLKTIMDIELYGTPMYVYPSPLYAANQMFENKHIDDRIGYVRTQFSFTGEQRCDGGKESEYWRALNECVGNEELSTTLMTPRDAMNMIKSGQYFEELWQGDPRGENKPRKTRITLMGIIGFDLEKQTYLGSRWFDVHRHDRDTLAEFVDLSNEAYETMQDENPDYEGIMKDYWDMMIDLSGSDHHRDEVEF